MAVCVSAWYRAYIINSASPLAVPSMLNRSASARNDLNASSRSPNSNSVAARTISGSASTAEAWRVAVDSTDGVEVIPVVDIGSEDAQAIKSARSVTSLSNRTPRLSISIPLSEMVGATGPPSGSPASNDLARKSRYEPGANLESEPSSPLHDGPPLTLSSLPRQKLASTLIVGVNSTSGMAGVT